MANPDKVSSLEELLLNVEKNEQYIKKTELETKLMNNVIKEWESKSTYIKNNIKTLEKDNQRLLTLSDYLDKIIERQKEQNLIQEKNTIYLNSYNEILIQKNMEFKNLCDSTLSQFQADFQEICKEHEDKNPEYRKLKQLKRDIKNLKIKSMLLTTQLKLDKENFKMFRDIQEKRLNSLIIKLAQQQVNARIYEKEKKKNVILKEREQALLIQLQELKQKVKEKNDKKNRNTPQISSQQSNTFNKFLSFFSTIQSNKSNIKMNQINDKDKRISDFQLKTFNDDCSKVRILEKNTDSSKPKEAVHKNIDFITTSSMFENIQKILNRPFSKDNNLPSINKNSQSKHKTHTNENLSCNVDNNEKSIDNQMNINKANDVKPSDKQKVSSQEICNKTTISDAKPKALENSSKSVLNANNSAQSFFPQNNIQDQNQKKITEDPKLKITQNKRVSFNLQYDNLPIFQAPSGISQSQIKLKSTAITSSHSSVLKNFVRPSSQNSALKTNESRSVSQESLDNRFKNKLSQLSASQEIMSSNQSSNKERNFFEIGAFNSQDYGEKSKFLNLFSDKCTNKSDNQMNHDSSMEYFTSEPENSMMTTNISMAEDDASNVVSGPLLFGETFEEPSFVQEPGKPMFSLF